jgi:hypothetical protein
MHSVALLALFVSATGCSTSWVPLNPAALKASQPRSIAVVFARTTGFMAWIPRTSILMMGGGAITAGITGAATALGAGKKIVADHNIEDPAITTRTDLFHLLSQKYALAISPSIQGGLENDELDFGDADLVLNVRTTKWGLGTYKGHARLFYSSRVDLINARTRRSLAHGECEFDAAKGAQTPTFDEMLANSAAILKGELTRVERLCFNRFKDRLLALGP